MYRMTHVKLELWLGHSHVISDDSYTINSGCSHPMRKLFPPCYQRTLYSKSLVSYIPLKQEQSQPFCTRLPKAVSNSKCWDVLIQVYCTWIWRKKRSYCRCYHGVFLHLILTYTQVVLKNNIWCCVRCSKMFRWNRFWM